MLQLLCCTVVLLSIYASPFPAKRFHFSHLLSTRGIAHIHQIRIVYLPHILSDSRSKSITTQLLNLKSCTSKTNQWSLPAISCYVKRR